MLDTFGRLPAHDQRVGRSGPPAVSGPKTWARLAGARLDVTPERSDAGLSTEADHTALQVGLSLGRVEAATGTWVLGLTGQYGRLDATVSNAAGSGTVRANGGGLGVTATWYGFSGTYADLQLQVNQVSLDFSSETQGGLADGVGTLLVAPSIEFGHRIPLGTNAALIPQGQLSGAWHLTDGFNDDRGVAVDLGETSATHARLGLTYERDAPARTGGPGRDRFYAIGNLLRTFGGDSAVDVGRTRLEQSDNRVWGEFGLGASVSAGPNGAFYAEASYRRALDRGGDGEAFAVTAGFRMIF